MGEKIVLSCERSDWRTPRSFLDVVRSFRPIVLDPCASQDPNEWFARISLNGNNLENGDGLKADWVKADGLVFMNPPYGGRKKAIDGWLRKAELESGRGCEIVGLVPAATGAQWFQSIWRSAQAVCFVTGRMRFELPGGDSKKAGATFWSAVPYWGAAVERFTSIFAAIGSVVVLRVGNAARKRLADGGAAHLPG